MLDFFQTNPNRILKKLAEKAFYILKCYLNSWSDTKQNNLRNVRQQPKLHTLLKVKAFVRIPSYLLLSNLNLDIAKIIGYNNKNLIKNKDIKIELNRFTITNLPNL